LNILITGCYGFIGSNLLLSLSKNKRNNVIGIYTKINKQRNHLIGNYNKLYELSMFDYSGLKKLITDHSIKLIIHTSWIGVSGDFKNSLTQSKNLTVIKNLVSLYKTCNLKKIIFFGSQAEYKRSKKVLSEGSAIMPVTQYGKSKSESLRYIIKSKINFLWLRLFDVYGPYDNPNWLIPNIIHSYKNNKLFKLNYPSRYWDFIFIDDLVKVIKKLIQKKSYGVFNLCSGNKIKLIDLAKIINPNLNNLILCNSENDFNLIGSNKKLIKEIGPYSFKKINTVLITMIKSNNYKC